MQSIIRRILGDRKLPDMTDEEYDRFMHVNFPKWITEFENGGFLESTKLTPIDSEDDFIRRLHDHRLKNDMLIVKFWKHGCLPCLGMAEMYKEAERRCLREGKNTAWYSVDTKSAPAKDLVQYSLVDGTPTIQTYFCGRIVGDEIRATTMDDLMNTIEGRLKSAKC